MGQNPSFSWCDALFSVDNLRRRIYSYQIDVIIVFGNVLGPFHYGPSVKSKTDRRHGYVITPVLNVAGYYWSLPGTQWRFI